MYIYVGTYVHLGTIFPKIGELGIHSIIILFFNFHLFQNWRCFSICSQVTEGDKGQEEGKGDMEMTLSRTG